MTPPSADPADEARLRALAGELADAVEAALAGWVQHCVHRHTGDPAALAAAARAGEQARAEVVPQVRALLETDIDVQVDTPLNLLREAVRYPTGVLVEAGVPEVARDEFAEQRFPHDPYDLTPASFADVDPALAEPGMRWGAAKAFVFKARRRAEGRR